MSLLQRELVTKLKSVLSAHGITLSLTPLINDERDLKYNRQTAIYKVPLTDSNVDSLELMCLLSKEAHQYSSQFQELIEDVVDFPTHALPILECYLDIPVEEKECFFYMRIPFGSKEDKSSATTLCEHIACGRWISEKLMMRWAVQLLRMLTYAHRNFLSFPEFDSRDIYIVSDELVLTSCKLQTKTMVARVQREEEAARKARIAARALRSSQGQQSEDKTDDDSTIPTVSTDVAADNVITNSNPNPVTVSPIKFPPLKSRTARAVPIPGVPVSGLPAAIPFVEEEKSVPVKDTELTKSDEENVCSGLQVKRLVPAPRRDAWIWIPLSNYETVEVETIPLNNGMDTLSTVTGLSTMSSAFCEDTLPTDLSPSSPTSGDRLRLPPIYRTQEVEAIGVEALTSAEVAKKKREEILRREASEESLRTVKSKRKHDTPVNFRWLCSHLVTAGKCLNDTMFEKLCVVFSEGSPDIASKCREQYAAFTRAVYSDLRSVGYILVEAYLRRPLTTVERENFRRLTFTYDDMMRTYDITRLTKGMRRLLQLCFTHLPDPLVIETQAERPQGCRELRAPCLRQIEEILEAITDEFWNMGGIDTREGALGNVNPPLWTKEDQEREDLMKKEYIEEMEAKAKKGIVQAHQRNIKHKKQLLFDMLPEAEQQSILRRRKARREAKANAAERNNLIQQALFHRWSVRKMELWLKDAISSCIKKNYYLKKSGVRMTLEQKHTYDRTAKVIEHAIGRILVADPYVPPVVKVEGAQAMLMQLKGNEKGGKLDKNRSANKKGKRQGSSAGDMWDTGTFDSRSQSPEPSRPGTASSSQEQDLSSSQSLSSVPASILVMKEMEEMSSLEKEKRYLHAIEYASANLGQLLAWECDNIESASEEQISVRCAITIAKHIRESISQADEKLSSSQMASLLPPLQFKEKLLVTASKILCNWNLLHNCSTRFAQKISMREKSWIAQVVHCLTFAMVVKYSADERLRHKGEEIAASRIQAFAKGYSVRRKMKLVWKQANEQFELEQQRKASRLAELETMNDMKIKASIKGIESDGDISEKIDISAEENDTNNLASVTLSKPYSTSASIHLSFAKGTRIPRDENKRSLQIKSIGRLLADPGVIPDLNATEFADTNSIDEVSFGVIEVIIDDSKRILSTRGAWANDPSVRTVDTIIQWEDAQSRYRRIQLGGTDDEAAGYIMVSGLVPHRKYKVRVMVNKRYRPRDKSQKSKKYVQGRDDFSEVKAIAVGEVQFTTDADAPCAPSFLPVDKMRFNHIIPVDASEQKHAGQEYALSEGISVVDKLEVFKSSLKGASKAGPRKSRRTLSLSGVSGQGEVTERRISCRLRWTVPYCNGSAVTEYEIQKMNHNGGWESLSITPQVNYTDTIPVIDRETGRENTIAVYRVRAGNDYGWSQFTPSLSVDLIDKISHKSPTRCNSSTSLVGMDRPQNSACLLPHGIMPRSPSATGKPKMELLNAVGLEEMIQRDMLNSRRPDSDCASRHQPGSGVPKSPTLNTESTLAGDTLEGVNSSLEAWLCRLSDVCPLERDVQRISTHQQGQDGITDVDHVSEHFNTAESVMSPVNHGEITEPVLEKVYRDSMHSPKKLNLSRKSKGKHRKQSSDEADDDDNIIMRLAMVHKSVSEIKVPNMESGKSTPHVIFASKTLPRNVV